MSLPEGVTAATLNAKVTKTTSSSPISISCSIVPSVDLTHEESGLKLSEIIETLANGPDPAAFLVPHSSQEGFVDDSEVAVARWYYIATTTSLAPSGSVACAPATKIFELPAGTTTVDLESLPTYTPPPIEHAAIDSGNTLGGMAAEGSSTAISPGAATGSAIRSLAAGVNADASTAVQDGTALGHDSSSTDDGGTAVGSGARAHATGVAVGKDATTGEFSESTAVGAGANTASSGAVAVGRDATAGNAATAVGCTATAAALAGSALGYGASTAGGAYSTALGTQTVTTRAYQTAIGPRSLLIGNSATVPSVDPTAGGELFVEDGALKYRGSEGTVTTIAPA